MVTRNAFLLTRHKRARHEAKTTTPEVSTCNLCNKKFASAALCKEHMSQCQASQVDVFFIFNLLVCLLSSAYVLCICSTILFGRWRIAQLVPGPATVNQSLPANQEADSAVQTCQMQWRPAPWPRHHLFATTAGRFLQMQRTLQDTSRSTTRGEFFL